VTDPLPSRRAVLGRGRRRDEFDRTAELLADAVGVLPTQPELDVYHPVLPKLSAGCNPRLRYARYPDRLRRVFDRGFEGSPGCTADARPTRTTAASSVRPAPVFDRSASFAEHLRAFLLVAMPDFLRQSVATGRPFGGKSPNAAANGCAGRSSRPATRRSGSRGPRHHSTDPGPASPRRGSDARRLAADPLGGGPRPESSHASRSDPASGRWSCTPLNTSLLGWPGKPRQRKGVASGPRRTAALEAARCEVERRRLGGPLPGPRRPQGQPERVRRRRRARW
jgi:hypothetical protein